MNFLPNQKHNLRSYHLLIMLLFFPIFLIYACPESTQVGPGTGAFGCFTATMKYAAPEECIGSSTCCDTNFASFVFVRTDVPDFDPLVKAPFAGGGLPILSEGGFVCTKTVKLSPSEVTNNGFGTWQVTHRFAPNWEVTCHHVEITQCPTLAHDPPVWVSHTRVGVDGCEQEKVIPGEDTIVPFPE